MDVYNGEKLEYHNLTWNRGLVWVMDGSQNQIWNIV